jgi:hypothetical protein
MSVRHVNGSGLRHVKRYDNGTASTTVDVDLVGDAEYPVIAVSGSDMLFDTGSASLAACWNANLGSSGLVPTGYSQCMTYGTGDIGYTCELGTGPIEVASVSTNATMCTLTHASLFGGDLFCGWSTGILGAAYSALNVASRGRCGAPHPVSANRAFHAPWLDVVTAHGSLEFGIGAREVWIGVSPFIVHDAVDFELKRAGASYYMIRDFASGVQYILDTGTPITCVAECDQTLYITNARGQRVSFHGFDRTFPSNLVVHGHRLLGYPALRQHIVQFAPFATSDHLPHVSFGDVSVSVGR